MICYYILRHPSSGVFYIGSTGAFKNRLQSHLRQLKMCTHPIKLLQEVYTFLPELSVETFETETLTEARAKERELIASNRGNPRLSNRMSNQLTAAQLAANKVRCGVPRTESTKAKISALHKGKLVSDIARERMASRKRGVPRPDGFIDRLAIINSVPVTIDGVKYESQKVAARHFGISTSSVRARLKSTKPKWSGWVT